MEQRKRVTPEAGKWPLVHSVHLWTNATRRSSGPVMDISVGEMKAIQGLLTATPRKMSPNTESSLVLASVAHNTS